MKMKTYINSKITILFVLVLVTVVSCERDISDDASAVGFSNDPEVFIDGFSAGLEYYPFGDSDFDAFTVDTETKYSGSAAMRLDVPNVGDPEGAYAGAIFRDDNGGRDLTDYDALTFWAKSSQAGTINEIGFGQDFGENKYQVSLSGLNLSTNWRKYVIAIPDASKLSQESGLFWYAEGPENGAGYTFWVDELKFEKLGTIAQYRPSIFEGEDLVVNTFIGVELPITAFENTVNLSTGIDQTVNVAPNYFSFTSSNESVATVSDMGIITVVGSGSAVVTASFGDLGAAGSLTINTLGDFELAPTPTRNPNNVTSIFSDHYTNVPVDFFNGYWEPFQTTLSSNFVVNGDNILNYTNFNFVGNQFANPTVDATEKSNLHINMYIPDDIPADLDFLISIKDFGADQADGGGDDTVQQVFFYANDFIANTWVTLEMPITLANRNNIGLIIYENINNPTTSSIDSFYLDNIYFYEIPTGPDGDAPTPTVPSANVISVFSDAYTNVSGSELNPNWGQGTVVTQEPIDGNNTLKYTGLDYQGLQLGSAQDVSGMTHLHIDYFTANSTALNTYLISSGPVEVAKALAVPTTSGWVSLEIPLADFSPVDLADIIQLKFDGNGDIYLDNIYFHN